MALRNVRSKARSTKNSSKGSGIKRSKIESVVDAKDVDKQIRKGNKERERWERDRERNGQR